MKVHSVAELHEAEEARRELVKSKRRHVDGLRVTRERVERELRALDETSSASRSPVAIEATLRPYLDAIPTSHPGPHREHLIRLGVGSPHHHKGGKCSQKAGPRSGRLDERRPGRLSLPATRDPTKAESRRYQRRQSWGRHCRGYLLVTNKREHEPRPAATRRRTFLVTRVRR